MKLRASVAAVGTTLALLAGGCSSVEIAPNRDTLQRPFDEMLPFWEGLGITSLNVTLVTVAEGSMPCGSRHITNDEISPATFCYLTEGEDTIFISDLSYERKEGGAGRKGISAEATGASVIAHELGHALIAQASLLVEGGDQEELLADCLAGVGVAGTAPELKTEAAAFFATIGSDNHGSDEERKAAFENGFNNGVAGCDPTLAIRLDIPDPTVK